MQEFELCAHLRGYAWYPEGDPVGIVQLIHGVAEHSGRYDRFAGFLTDHGYLVVASDHPGHGKSIPEGEAPGFLTGGWMGTVKGLHQVYEKFHSQYPSLPYYMLGHSMGSFLLRTYLFTYDTPLSGAVISGTGWQPAFILPLGLFLCKMEAARLGERNASSLLQSMMFGGYNRKFAPNRTAFDWLSTDPAVVDAYVKDPLCGFATSIQLCAEMMGGLQMIQRSRNLSRMRKDLPVHFFAGEQDPVGDMGKGVLRTVEAFRKAGMQQVTCKLYPNMRHEALNEIGKEQVYGDILQWLHDH